MKYFYISLFLSITFLVIGTAASIEQKHSKAKAETELMESQDLHDDDAPEVKLTFGEKCLQAISSFLTGLAIVVVIFFLYAIAIIVFTKFFEIIIQDIREAVFTYGHITGDITAKEVLEKINNYLLNQQVRHKNKCLKCIKIYQ